MRHAGEVGEEVAYFVTNILNQTGAKWSRILLNTGALPGETAQVC